MLGTIDMDKFDNPNHYVNLYFFGYIIFAVLTFVRLCSSYVVLSNIIQNYEYEAKKGSEVELNKGETLQGYQSHTTASVYSLCKKYFRGKIQDGSRSKYLIMPCNLINGYSECIRIRIRRMSLAQSIQKRILVTR